MKKALKVVAANVLILGILLGSLELFAYLLIERPFNAFLPSWRFNHVRKPLSELTASEFFAFNPRMAKKFGEDDRWVTNNQGWVEYEDTTSDKPPGAYRVFYLGDSFVEGHTLQDYALTNQLAEKLRKQSGAPANVEFINAGTSSYSPSLYYIVTKYKVLDLKPDLIIVNIDMTDDLDEFKYLSRLIVDSEGNPEAVPFLNATMAGTYDARAGVVRATPWTRLILFLNANSRLFTLIQFYMADSSNMQVGHTEEDDLLYPRWAWCKKEWSEKVEKNVETMFDKIERLVALCREHDIKIALASVPHYAQFAPEEADFGPEDWSPRPHEELANLAAELNTPYLNCFDELQPIVTAAEPGRYYYLDDVHFNREGNGVWADAHVRFLLREDLGLLRREEQAQ